MVTYLPLKTIDDVFVATESYLTPFAKYKANFQKKEDFFQEAAFIMLDKENISRKHVDNFLAENHISLSNVIEVNNMDLSIEFAKAGLGIACIISDFVKNDLKNGTLREVKLGHRIPKRQIGFAYLAKVPVLGVMDKLIQYCQLSLG